LINFKTKALFLFSTIPKDAQVLNSRPIQNCLFPKIVFTDFKELSA
jgi:hypothetical protein